MTKARSYLTDNGGLCESCDRPESEHECQTAYPVLLGGGLGQGTMWLCPGCLEVHQNRDAAATHTSPQAGPPARNLGDEGQCGRTDAAQLPEPFPADTHVMLHGKEGVVLGAGATGASRRVEFADGLEIVPVEHLSEWPKGTDVLPTLGPNVPPPDPDAWDDTHDQPLPEDADIDAAFPTRSGRHDLYAEAMRLVGARRSKSGLVALVNWLLHRAAKQGA